MVKKIRLSDDFSSRIYQQSIFANSLEKNSLVVLPTGLGKTVIALMLCVYYFNKSNKKILFLAPTKPLVEQQEKSFKGFIKNNDEISFLVLTGMISPQKRTQMYLDNDFIFSTPQIIENDIINGIIDVNNFGFVVIDEAHRAVGNYSYCFIAEKFSNANIKMLSLTASPATNSKDLEKILANLKIEHLEVKTYDDEDVKPYVKGTDINKIFVDLSDDFKTVLTLLRKTYDKKLESLKQNGYFKGKSISLITKKDILALQQELRLDISGGLADENIFKSISLCASLMKLGHGIDLFETEQVESAHSYFYNFFNKDKTKAVELLLIDSDFRLAYEIITKLKKNNVKHPKLLKLIEIVCNELEKNKNLKIIIFNQYRDSASTIVNELSQIKEIKPVLFIGQSKKGDISISQKEQKKIINDFRCDQYNVLVSTSVGEEGLDIPKVDLVIFYEPVPSAIRSIQRIGRTGRFQRGLAYVLITQGTKDVLTSYVSKAKEKKMYEVLDYYKKKLETTDSDLKNKKNNLNNYINENTKKEEIVIENPYMVYIDSRENSDLIKELYKFEDIEVKVKKLDVADIVISDYVAIERKSKKDFVDSIIDKRLFPQIMNLIKNYKRPLLILEGSENIYSLRNINPAVIRSVLCCISVEFRVPILYTDSISETATMISVLVKRYNKEKKEINLGCEKSAITQKQEQEIFLASIPKVNIATSKQMLSHFKNIKTIVNSSADELCECKGLGKIRSKSLFEFFNRDY